MNNILSFLVDKLFMVAGRNIQAIFLNLYKVFLLLYSKVKKNDNSFHLKGQYKLEL